MYTYVSAFTICGGMAIYENLERITNLAEKKMRQL